MVSRLGSKLPESNAADFCGNPATTLGRAMKPFVPSSGHIGLPVNIILGAPLLILLNPGDFPSPHDLPCRSPDIREFLARSKGRFIAVAQHQVVGVVVDAVALFRFAVISIGSEARELREL